MASLFPLLSLLVLVFSLQFQPSSAGGAVSSLSNSSSNTSAPKCGGNTNCVEGVMLPIWQPVNPARSERVARAIIYFLAMAYTFLGVSIIADRFMASIEVITSQERQVTIKKPNGEKVTATVRIWNETVSNLTLMALGSSAPEILLSVVEVCGHDFKAGELGPNTIVGSAAFNMFVIIGLCVSVIPDGETRRVKHLRVFFVTAAWSVFAYIWLYLILAVLSPGVVDIWEGLLTLFFFPLCVGFAYVADRRLLFYKYVHKRYRAGKRRGVIIETEGEPEPAPDVEMLTANGQELDAYFDWDQEETRREVAAILKELKQRHPEKELEQLTELANTQVLNQTPKSRAFYRCQATRLMTGAGNVLRRGAAERDQRGALQGSSEALESFTQVFFDPGSYQCLENCGSVALTVVRRGGDLTQRLTVTFQTEDGTALAGSDYTHSSGTVAFEPGETEGKIHVPILDDDIYEEDEHFLVRLSGVSAGRDHAAILGTPSCATVTVFDDDHAGVFSFEVAAVTVSESAGVMEARVLRSCGARGAVAVPYRTVEGSARGGGEDYEDTHGVLEFADNEIVKSFHINIIDDDQYEKNKNLFVELGEPRLLEMTERKALLLQETGGLVKTGKDLYRKVQGRETPSTICITDWSLEQSRVAEMGRPSLGENSRLEVTIEESYEFKNTVDKLIKKTNLALLIGTNSWRQQFVEAINVSSAGEDSDGPPSCCDYLMHFLTLLWKVLFALVPPTDYLSGWPCFCVSICGIGLLTALIGDLASHFGCTVGLKDSVTAVVFVALGTSVPDTFASKVAAVQDQFADASIGNVTGSNAVNVFLGIGVAWSIAAVVHWWRGEQFKVDPGTLAFSVTLFTIFAFVCIAVLVWRRRPSVGGELGGPRGPKALTSALFFSLWLLYIIFSSLEAYCHVQGF